MQDGLTEQVSFLGLRGRHLTDAHAAFLADDRAALEAYQRRAEQARLASERAVPWYLQNLHIIPSPSQPDLTLDDLIADLPEPVRLTAGELSRVAGFLGDVATTLNEDGTLVGQTASALEWLFGHDDFDIAGRLAAENGMSWTRRGADLDRFEQDLLLALGDLAPLWARDAANRVEVSEAHLSQITGLAARLAQLLDDVRDATGEPSRLQRALFRLHAAALILESSNSQLEMTEINSVFNSLGTIFPGTFSPTGPFAMQSGVITGQLESVRQGMLDAADALTAVEDASRGVPGALERAQDAAGRLQSRFTGPALRQEIMRGLLGGSASNLPFVRYFAGAAL